MELAPVPRRRPWSWRARTAVTVLVLAPVFVLALVPAAFGLERYVMTTDAADVAPRGSVVLARDVPLGDLEDGDVVTFAPTGTTRLVSGAVIGVDGAGAAVEVDDDRVLITDRTTVSRLVVAVPLVGYPFLGAAYSPALALVALLAGSVLGALFLRDSWRAPPRNHDLRPNARAAGRAATR